jgi:protocatechuate 3,4-dioxygenase beta subunit
MLSIFVVVGLWFIPSSAGAQTSTATLSGTVVDTSGAPIPQVALRVVNDATGGRRVTETNTDGRFTVTSLAPSRYRVTAEKDGFQKSELSGWCSKSAIRSASTS